VFDKKLPSSVWFLVLLVIRLLLFSLVVSAQIVTVDFQNCAEHIVVLLELTTVSCKNFVALIDICINVVKFEVRRWVLHFSLADNNFQNLIFQRCLLQVFYALFPRNFPFLFPCNLLLDMDLTILFS
jgi:hypothetical protein